ncbi:hypothetical protein MBLNU459_g2351t1 [Dothideomycetes sp. NU459]
MAPRGLFSSIKRKVLSSNHNANSQDPTPSFYPSTLTREHKSVVDPSYSTPRIMNSDRRPNSSASTPSDAPPAYSALPPPSASSSEPPDSAADSAYAFLGSFDTVFLIDDSGSMAGSRWRETAAALEAIVPVCVAHDADGIDMAFLNAPDSPRQRNLRTAAAVRDVFASVRPRGGTPTGQRLAALLRPYVRRCDALGCDAVKPLNVIVVTDGAPSDDVEAALIGAARRLDRLDAPAWQVGVQFFQVGRDPDASRHLRMLDDELAEIAGESLRDMVDTVPFRGAEGETLSGDGILKVVLGAVNRRLDRKRSGELYR